MTPGGERSRKWRKDHPEKSRAGCRAYHANNAEAVRERKRSYYQEVRKPKDKTDLGRFKDRSKKAARRSAIGSDTVTPEEWAEIRERFDHQCAYCPARPQVLEMDHVKPLARGGRHIASNIVPACKSCNSAKGAR